MTEQETHEKLELVADILRREIEEIGLLQMRDEVVSFQLGRVSGMTWALTLLETAGLAKPIGGER